MRKTILLVEDDRELRGMLFKIFTDIGYRVSACRNGQIAIQYIKDSDLLITDFHMPKMNGAELAKTAKRQKPGIPVIIMTGVPSDVPRNHEADKIIEKPFKLSVLEDIVARLLEK